MYSAYHRDGRNQATHHLGVPLIVFSLMVIAARVELMVFSGGPITLAGLLMAVLLLLYIYCAPLIGSLAVLFYGVLLFCAEAVAQSTTTTEGILVFGGTFLGGWIIQFVGHSFEGRKPALFDNLLQVFMAPSFLLAEVLFYFGFEENLRAELARRMPRYLPKSDEQSGQKSAPRQGSQYHV